MVRLPADSLAWAMHAAAGLIVAVQEGQSLNETFERRAELWPDTRRAAVRDLVWRTLRDYGRGDFILAECLSKPLPGEVHAVLLIALNRLAARPQDTHTTVNQAVDAVAAYTPGLRAVANGVLRRVLREWPEWQARIEQDAVAAHGHPAWWQERLRKQYGTDTTAAILAAGNMHPPMSVRANLRRTSVTDLQARLQASGHASRRLANDALLLDTPCAVDALPGFGDGDCSVQDAGAQWAAQWLDLADGLRVLDACAAPGGKAAHMLERADIALTALELDATRSTRIRNNLARLGLSAALPVGDASQPRTWWDGRPFDRILADVPCSASGVVRRHPDIKWLRRADDIERFARQQARILDALWPLLAPGGKLLYVTCSLFASENEEQVARFLARHADARSQPLPGHEHHCHTVLPGAEHDGFFYALLSRHG